MAVFITNLEVMPASEKEIKVYYETATKRINTLFVKYDIHNSKGELEKVSADKCKALLTFSGFCQTTPLKSIFFDQKQQFVPQEIIQAFHNIISDPPTNIKAVFFNKFITLLAKKGWDKPLSRYFEEQYDFPSDGIIILEELQDYSFGFGIYRATFQLRTMRKEKITLFLKGVVGIESCNELLYFNLQKRFLSTTNDIKMPFILSNNENKQEVLLSPLIPGVASDTVLSKLTQFHRESQHDDHKSVLKKALEIIIEEFFCHAAFGDLLGRNDRHLMNSFIASVVDGVPQRNTLENLSSLEKILDFAKTIVTNKTKAFSLIGFDLAWLLGERNVDWMLADIDFGLSELNLLSLLEEFNDYNFDKNPFYEERKGYIEHYYNIYCQKQEAILEKKETIFSEIEKYYSPKISEEKLKILKKGISGTYPFGSSPMQIPRTGEIKSNKKSTSLGPILPQKIACYPESKQIVIKFFKRYLLNYRIRRIYKSTLYALHKIAIESNNINLLNALKESRLLKYIPPSSVSDPDDLNVFLQLQCFRGVLSKEDMMILSEEGRTSWETIASNISMLAKQFNSTLYKDLSNKILFIKNDTKKLLKDLL